jgi:Ca2+-binding EF-hand superfamily protein
MLISEADLMRHSTVPWYELFFLLDKNEDGSLSIQEFAQGFHQLMGPSSSLTVQHLEALGRKIDADSSSQIEWMEWVAVALITMPGFPQDLEPVHNAFRLLDRPSNDYSIHAADVLAVVSGDNGDQLSGDQVKKVLKRWAPKTKRRPGQVPTLPALQFSDLRQVFESLRSEEVHIPESASTHRPPGPRVWMRSQWNCFDSAYSPGSWCAGVTKSSQNEMQVVQQKRACSESPQAEAMSQSVVDDLASRDVSRVSQQSGATGRAVSPRTNSKAVHQQPQAV